MKHKFLRIICVLTPFLFGALAHAATRSRELTSFQIKKVEAAVQDEIYDYNYFKSYYQIGENIGTSDHWISRSHIFINPIYNIADRNGQIIYNLMPYGQVYRFFFINKNGSVQLDGDPQNHFPITQPSRLTVYMDEEEIARDEQSWVKGFFVIDTAANDEIVEAAAKRQKAISGFSYWEHQKH